MKTTILSEDTIFENKAVATIGFFDGVHRGHQFLLKHVVDLQSRQYRQPVLRTPV